MELDMGIRDHWISLLHSTATGTRKTRTLLTPIGLIIFGVFTGVFVALSMLTDRWLSLALPLPSGPTWILAALLITVGVSVTAWSALHFLKVKGTPVPFNPPPKLVITGPYRLARNPMLTGVFLLLFGIGFAIKSLSLVVFFTPLYMGAQKNRGAGVGEEARGRLHRLLSTDTDVYTSVEAYEVTSMPDKWQQSGTGKNG